MPGADRTWGDLADSRFKQNMKETEERGTIPDVGLRSWEATTEGKIEHAQLLGRKDASTREDPSVKGHLPRFQCHIGRLKSMWNRSEPCVPRNP